ncbi:MAG: hypothetical protein ABIJ37_02630 [Pseudomonadota bacterium]
MKLSKRKHIVKIVMLFECIFLCLIVVALYIFAWKKGASPKSIIISGSAVLFSIISLSFFIYFFSVRIIAKRQIDDSFVPIRDKKYENWLKKSFIIITLINILGLYLVFMKNMIRTSAIILLLNGIVTYFLYKKRSTEYIQQSERISRMEKEKKEEGN